MEKAAIEKKLKDILHREHSKGPSISLIISKPEYENTAISLILEHLTKTLKLNGIYVSLTKSCSQIKKLVREEDYSKILFIETIKHPGNSCEFISDANSLTKISIVLSKRLRDKKYRFAYLDSPTVLRMNNNYDTSIRFVHYFINKIRNVGVEGILISLPSSEKELIKALSDMCDQVIDLT